MRILAFSDMHHHRAKAEALVDASREADLVIGAGDFCNRREGLIEAMNLLSGITVPMVVVPGNAESVEELRNAAHPGTTVLHGSLVEIDGLTIFGIGYAIPETPFGDWSCDLGDAQAADILATCDTADILVSHSPPQGVGDQTSAGVSIGSTAVRDATLRIQPKLLLCGHIHDSWGTDEMLGQTRVRNLGPTPNWFDLP